MSAITMHGTEDSLEKSQRRLTCPFPLPVPQEDYISQPALQSAVTRPALADELCAEVSSTCSHHRSTRAILLMFYLPR